MQLLKAIWALAGAAICCFLIFVIHSQFLKEARIIKTKQWCEMLPCLEGEGCNLLINKSGWTCTQPGGRIKTTTVS
ncbi:chemokine-like protein TAFA-5a isoform X2 [Latimeria chalumnae]|uniref:chemokine-like protein TAFA-5a isoform X2 n=1 Tax=Latimeria chalumnae TaxID=7897 RepID=UPI00313CD746